MEGGVTDWLSAAGTIFSAVAAFAALWAVIEANRISRSIQSKAASDALDALLDQFDAESSRLQSRVAIAEQTINDLEAAVRVFTSKQGALGFVDRALGERWVEELRQATKRASRIHDEQVVVVNQESTARSVRLALRSIVRCISPIEATIERARELRETFSSK